MARSGAEKVVGVADRLKKAEDAAHFEKKETRMLLTSAAGANPSKDVRDDRMASFPLEIELQAELNNARIARGQNLSEAGGIARDVRREEIGAVKCIEQFGAELEVAPLAKIEVLRQREVEID